MTDKQFPKGIYIKEVETKFGGMLKISINENIIDYYNEHKNSAGYINIDVKRKQADNSPYLELNTYVKKEVPKETQESFSEEFDDEVPW